KMSIPTNALIPVFSTIMFRDALKDYISKELYKELDFIYDLGSESGDFLNHPPSDHYAKFAVFAPSSGPSLSDWDVLHEVVLKELNRFLQYVRLNPSMTLINALGHFRGNLKEWLPVVVEF